MTPSALADEKPLRVARVAKNLLVDQRVVEHEVRGAQARDRLSRQQPGIAWPCTDKGDVTTVRCSVHLEVDLTVGLKVDTTYVVG